VHQRTDARETDVAAEVPATAPFAPSVRVDTVGSVTALSAAPVAFASIEQVVSDTVPVKLMVPSAACAPVEASATVPIAATVDRVERMDFIWCPRGVDGKVG